MCGLVGFVDYSKSIYQKDFDEAVDMLKHRGPDERGSRIHNEIGYDVGLGHRRLSILDFYRRANQPFYTKDVGLIYNGEIYNFKDVRKELINLNYNFNTTSDTEVIIKAYNAWGLDCINKFVGMFAFALYDKKQQEIHLVRDRLGVKPLYCYTSKSKIIFSSDVIAINSILKHSLNIDKSSLHGFFSLGYIPGDLSIFKKVKKIKPGHILSLKLKTREISIKKYWDIKDFYNDYEFTDKNKLELKNKLEDAIKLRLVSDVEVGSYLSGGLDSSYTTKILSEHSNYKIRTFTVGFKAKYDEAPHAKRVAELLNTKHTTYYITPEDISKILSNYSAFFTEPFADNTAIPMLYLSQHAKEHVKVVVSSDGGDELFAGYYIYINLLKYHKKLLKIPRLTRPVIKLFLRIFYFLIPNRFNIKNTIWKLKHILDANDNNQFRKLIFYGSRLPRPNLSKVINQEILKAKFSHFFNFNNLTTKSNLKKILYIDIHERLANQMLVKVDKSTMGSSIEGREPLLDHRLYEFMYSFSEKSFINKGVTKYQFRKIINNAFHQNKIIQKPKQSFETPLLKWLKVHYSEYVVNEIKSINTLNIPYLKQKQILQMWDNYDNLKSNNKELIWRILVYIQWYKTYMTT